MKKSEREPPTPLKNKIDFFSFSDFFFLLLRGKNCGTRKQARKESEEREESKNIVEATKNRGRLAEREAGPYDQAILGKG